MTDCGLTMWNVGLGDNPKSAALLELVLTFPPESMGGLKETCQWVWGRGLRQRRGRLMVRRALTPSQKEDRADRVGGMKAP